MATRQLKARIIEKPVTVEISVSDGGTSYHLTASGEDGAPLYFRRAAYFLPVSVVREPMPTLTCRHLEQATVHLLQGREHQALLAFKRAVASAIDPPSLIKVALACHTEGYRDEAQVALARGLRYALRDAYSSALIRSIATHLGYPLDA